MYATAGAGHRRAAEALTHAISQRCPGAQVECLDVLHHTPYWFRVFYEWSYLLLVRHVPWIWKLSYRSLDHALLYRLVEPLRRAWNLFIARRFVNLLKDEQPAIVVCTHFLAANICHAGKRAGWFTGALVVMVTDLYPHWFWVAPTADAMVVATPESARVLERRGIAAARIHVAGIPIAQAFGRSMDHAALQRRFGLIPERLTVLVTSGGTTVGHFESVVWALMALEGALPGRLQLLVVCGEDERTRHRLFLRAQTSAMPTQVFGFVDYMPELMAASDLVVAKAGGLTVSEALGRGLPLILYHVIPGQEQMNAQYVERHGAGLMAKHPRQIADVVRQCVEQPERLYAMRQAARSIGRPNAAEEIAAEVIKPLLQSVDRSP